MTKGLPASGKTTWAREHVKSGAWVRINRDDLRNMRGQYWIPSQEELITQWEDWCVILALQQGLNVVLDATNLNDERSKSRVDSFRQQIPKLKFETKFFDTPLDVCLKRDAKRADGVGETVIMRMYDKYLKPAATEYKEDVDLPPCIICDIDGTLAKMYNRGPFEWHKVGNDKLNWPIYDILDKFNDTHVIQIFSGRDGVCRKETEEWLATLNVPYDNLVMREKGSQEADEKVKAKMFEDYVRGKYNCSFVLDDRNKVVRMWREDLGLTCLQVDYGNF